ncbi:ACP phosphodiesterase [Litorivivens sp.]|uniref:acyl carrier protein phosphodiesterase n=1 Tax=Litorivivens sp. TaxID=2020868 RepID=UPI0035627CCC
MNYLAHFHLACHAAGSDDPHPLVIGGLLGDFVKGPLRGEWRDWEAGIVLHRRIDALTDSHPEVIALLNTLPANYRRYGGIMLDVCFDYCLSQHWGNFHHTTLPHFCAQMYQRLEAEHPALPPKARQQAQRLQRYDVLGNMDNWQTVANMLARIGQRLRRDNPLDSSAAVLAERLPIIEQHFLRLYPELMDTVRQP